MILKHDNGTHTYLKAAGEESGPPLMLLHGIGADHHMWEPQMAAFAEAGYYVLAPDLLGHGQSSRVEALSLADWDRQIISVIDLLGLGDCIFIGVSMGGVVAQSFAMRYPGRVRKLVISDTFGELKTFQEKMLGASQLLGFRIYKLLGAKLLAKGMEAAYKADYAAQAREYMSRVSMQADFDQLILARKAINQIDAIGEIDGAQIPTLVLVGAEFGQSFVEINRKIADNIAGAEFVVLDQSMDPSNLVNPEAFNREVLGFLRE